MMTVGQNIKFYRTQLGISQGELAKRCGHNTENDNGRSWVSKIEKGINDPPTTELKLIAKALGVTCVELMQTSSDVPEEKEIENTFDLLKQDFGQDVFIAVQLFLKLDVIDRAEIMENMRFKLSREKYSTQDGSKTG